MSQCHLGFPDLAKKNQGGHNAYILSQRIRRAGDDEEAIAGGEKLPQTFSHDQVSALIARRLRAHDKAAHEANLKRAKGQIPVPANMADMVDK